MSALGRVKPIVPFTSGVSLKAWSYVGLFDREVALRRVFRPHLGGITLVIYGDASARVAREN